MKKFVPGYYRHVKGKKYLALGIAKHSETLEPLVVYISLYENETSQMWLRPLEMFMDDVEVNGKKVPRFKFISEK
ncbi:DUF1653 domain-containing protein [Candidatus Dojkabacteria bacterium]|uniref:DUF1653 domain-containing protein n=1 Tax=Candidatus Dojkabacteria bacterium TaxID=2099670 RepID=A0A955L0V2_9BACT|nr:DUF1653 domain-containing protein [Candidatus Dojkabacteria bacterium]